jgi:SPP1 gp7 family putative phage head morphogenesis protein
MASLNDKLVDRFVQHDVNLLRFEASQRQAIIRSLRELELSILRRMERHVASPFTKARQQALLKAVQSAIQSGYKQILTDQKQTLVKLAAFETGQVRKLVNTQVGFSGMQVGVPETVLASMVKDDVVLGAPLKSFWQKQAGNLQQAFVTQMRQGIFAGDTKDQLIQRLRGTKAHNFEDGVMGISRRGAETVVRTTAQSILNDARLETYKANADVLQGVQAIVTLDARTSDICMARSGMAWDFDGNPLNDETDIDFPGPPPWHPNCRTTLVPLVKSVGQLLGGKKGAEVDAAVAKAVKKLPKATQASLDGQIPKTLTYEDWLKGKPAAFQLEVLGPGKYRLWKAGKISLRDLIDQRGRPLTLEELKQLDGEE